MFEKLRLVEGETIANRARYWIYRRVVIGGIPSSQIDFDGVSRKTVWNFVSGGRDTTLEKLGKVATALNCDVVDLLQPIPGEMAKPRSKVVE